MALNDILLKILLDNADALKKIKQTITSFDDLAKSINGFNATTKSMTKDMDALGVSIGKIENNNKNLSKTFNDNATNIEKQDNSTKTYQKTITNTTEAIHTLETNIKGQIASINSNTTAIKGNIQALQTENSFINSNNTAIKGNIAAYNSQTTAINGDIKALHTLDTSIQGNISNLNSNKTAIQGNIGALHTLETAIKTEKVVIEGAVQALNAENVVINNVTNNIIRNSTVVREQTNVYQGFQNVIWEVQTAFNALGKVINQLIDSPFIEWGRQVEVNFRNMNSIGLETEEQFKQTKQAVYDLANKEGLANLNDLSDGLREIYSSGYEGKQALELLEAANQGAGAGLAQTAEQLHATISILHSYGLATSEAARVNNILVKTVQDGVVTLPELSRYIGQAVTLAPAFKKANGETAVSLDQVAAAIVGITRQGLNISETTVAINQLFKTFLDPAKEAKELADSLNIDLSSKAFSERNFAEVIQDVLAKTNGPDQDDLLGKLFGNIRALKGLFKLARDDAQFFKQEIDVIMSDYDKQNNAQKGALAEQRKTYDQHLKALTLRWEVAAQNLFDIAKFLAAPFIAIVDTLIQTFNLLPGWFKTLVAGFVVITFNAGVLAAAFVTLKLSAMAAMKALLIVGVEAEILAKGLYLLRTAAIAAWSYLVIPAAVFVGLNLFNEWLKSVDTPLSRAISKVMDYVDAINLLKQAAESLSTESAVIENSKNYNKSIDEANKKVAELLKLEEERFAVGKRLTSLEKYELARASLVLDPVGNKNFAQEYAKDYLAEIKAAKDKEKAIKEVTIRGINERKQLSEDASKTIGQLEDKYFKRTLDKHDYNINKAKVDRDAELKQIQNAYDQQIDLVDKNGNKYKLTEEKYRDIISRINASYDEKDKTLLKAKNDYITAENEKALRKQEAARKKYIDNVNIKFDPNVLQAKTNINEIESDTQHSDQEKQKSLIAQYKYLQDLYNLKKTFFTKDGEEYKKAQLQASEYTEKIAKVQYQATVQGYQDRLEKAKEFTQDQTELENISIEDKAKKIKLALNSEKIIYTQMSKDLKLSFNERQAANKNILAIDKQLNKNKIDLQKQSLDEQINEEKRANSALETETNNRIKNDEIREKEANDLRINVANLHLKELNALLRKAEKENNISVIKSLKDEITTTKNAKSELITNYKQIAEERRKIEVEQSQQSIQQLIANDDKLYQRKLQFIQDNVQQNEIAYQQQLTTDSDYYNKQLAFIDAEIEAEKQKQSLIYFDKDYFDNLEASRRRIALLNEARINKEFEAEKKLYQNKLDFINGIGQALQQSNNATVQSFGNLANSVGNAFSSVPGILTDITKAMSGDFSGVIVRVLNETVRITNSLGSAWDNFNKGAAKGKEGMQDILKASNDLLRAVPFVGDMLADFFKTATNILGLTKSDKEIEDNNKLINSTYELAKVKLQTADKTSKGEIELENLAYDNAIHNLNQEKLNAQDYANKKEIIEIQHQEKLSEIRQKASEKDLEITQALMTSQLKLNDSYRNKLLNNTLSGITKLINLTNQLARGEITQDQFNKLAQTNQNEVNSNDDSIRLSEVAKQISLDAKVAKSYIETREDSEQKSIDLANNAFNERKAILDAELKYGKIQQAEYDRELIIAQNNRLVAMKSNAKTANKDIVEANEKNYKSELSIIDKFYGEKRRKLEQDVQKEIDIIQDKNNKLRQLDEDRQTTLEQKQTRLTAFNNALADPNNQRTADFYRANPEDFENGFNGNTAARQNLEAGFNAGTVDFDSYMRQRASLGLKQYQYYTEQAKKILDPKERQEALNKAIAGQEEFYNFVFDKDKEKIELEARQAEKRKQEKQKELDAILILEKQAISKLDAAYKNSAGLYKDVFVQATQSWVDFAQAAINDIDLSNLIKKATNDIAQTTQGVTGSNNISNPQPQAGYNSGTGTVNIPIPLPGGGFVNIPIPVHAPTNQNIGSTTANSTNNLGSNSNLSIDEQIRRLTIDDANIERAKRGMPLLKYHGGGDTPTSGGEFFALMKPKETVFNETQRNEVHSGILNLVREANARPSNNYNNSSKNITVVFNPVLHNVDLANSPMLQATMKNEFNVFKNDLQNTILGR